MMLLRIIAECDPLCLEDIRHPKRQMLVPAARKKEFD